MDESTRIKELEAALRKLIEVCYQVDGWDQFPSAPLDEAEAALNNG